MRPSSGGADEASAGGAAAGERALLEAARAVRERAHSPYSGVRVGAALVAADGRVFTGCNVESASFGLTICAERSALVQAVAAGARAFQRLVIVANRPAPLPPCGACRQLLREFGGELAVLSVGDAGGRLEATLEELLPQAFVGEELRLGRDREQRA